MTWTWIAGFFEGEGNISFLKGKPGTKQGTSGRIVIGQKDIRPLLAIQSFLKTKGFNHVLLYQRPAWPPRVPNPIWILALNYRTEVIWFLRKIAPMLFEKQKKVRSIATRLQKMNRERDQALRKALQMKRRGMTWCQVADACGIGRRALHNYARSKGTPLPKG